MSYIFLISPERRTQRLGHRLAQNKDLVELNRIKLSNILVHGIAVISDQTSIPTIKSKRCSFLADPSLTDALHHRVV